MFNTPLSREAHAFVQRATGRADMLVKVKEAKAGGVRGAECLAVYNVWAKAPDATRGRKIGCMFAHTKNRRSWL